jgi:hypothetical protein
MTGSSARTASQAGALGKSAGQLGLLGRSNGPARLAGLALLIMPTSTLPGASR